VSADQVLTGIALIVVLAVGSQLLAGRLRIPALIRRQDSGARVVARPASQPPDGDDLLFVIRQDGSLEPVTDKARPRPRAGDTSVLLGQAPGEATADDGRSPLAGDLLPGTPGGACGR
jgi:hypothetical protein